MTRPDKPGKPTVIIPASEFRLPEVLRYLEAGKIVIVIIPAADDTS
jgi:hypothetical protein